MNLLMHPKFVFDELFIRIEKREYAVAIQDLHRLLSKSSALLKLYEVQYLHPHVL